jgi:hypothetical protein
MFIQSIARQFLFHSVIFGTLVIANTAFAGEEVWSSKSGKTNFSMPGVTACSQGKGSTINYQTIYSNVPYSGKLSVQNVEGCKSRQTIITGYFVEINNQRKEKCRGKLVLTLNNTPNYINGRGVASWQTITAVPGFRCSNSGQTADLSLIQTGP